jgi:putative chitinase
MQISRADLKKFAPRANQEYVDVLLAGQDVLRRAGVLDSEYRLCHFMAQIGHETGGLAIIRESVKYTPKRMRQARLDDHERSMPSIDGIKMIRGAA